MIDLSLDPFSPGHEADLARVGEELAPEAGVGRDHLLVVGGWRPLSPIDPWFPTAKERRKGLWRWGPAGRVRDVTDQVQGRARPSQAEVEDLRRHAGGPFGSAAHEHWRALTVVAVEVPSLVEEAVGTAPPALALLTDRDVVVLVRGSAATMADAKDRLAALEAGVAQPASPLAPFRHLGSTFSTLGRDVAAIARGEQRADGLVIRSKSPVVGSSVAPVSAVDPIDHLRWRFVDGSWLDVRLPHPEAAARREVLRRIGEAGVPVGPEERFLLEP